MTNKWQGLSDHHAAGAVVQRLELGAGGCKQAGGVVGADQVDLDDLGKVLQRRSLAVLADHAFGGADASDLHQDAGRAVGGCRRVYGPSHPIRIAHIAGQAQSANVTGHALGLVLIEVEHRHLGAQSGQFTGGGFAQTRSAAGHERGCSLDVHGDSFLVDQAAASGFSINRAMPWPPPTQALAMP